MQRLLKTQNPRIAEVNVDDLVDNRFIRKLDESGFFRSNLWQINKPETDSRSFPD